MDADLLFELAVNSQRRNFEAGIRRDCRSLWLESSGWELGDLLENGCLGDDQIRLWHVKKVASYSNSTFDYISFISDHLAFSTSQSS